MSWKDYREGREVAKVILLGIALIIVVFSLLHFVFDIPFFP